MNTSPPARSRHTATHARITRKPYPGPCVNGPPSLLVRGRILPADSGRLSTAPTRLAGGMQIILFGRGTGRASRPQPGAPTGGRLQAATNLFWQLRLLTCVHSVSTLATSPIPTVICGGSAGTPLGRPGARLGAPFAERNQRADVAGTDPGRRDKRHRPFRKRKIVSAERTVVFVIRHAARTRRRRRARPVDVSGPHPMRPAGCTRR